MTPSEVEHLPYARATGMVREFGGLYRLLRLGASLTRLKLPDPAADRIRAAADGAGVVYVLGRASAIDQLALNTRLVGANLPLAVWSNGRATVWWQTLGAAWRVVKSCLRARLSGDDGIASGSLARAIAAGRTVAVFLDDRRWFGNSPDPLEAVLAANEIGGPPIRLVPVVVLWDRSPERAHETVQEFLFGSAPVPGILGGLGNAWFRSASASIQVAEPLDLGVFCSRFAPELRARALRTLLRRTLRRESETVRGPRLLPWETMRRLVLDNPVMKQIADEEAAAHGVAPERVIRRMGKDYDAIAADFQWWVIRLLELVLRPLWTRVFSGVDVRPEDLERIRKAMRDGTAVLVPCHKSHLDYVLLSWVFYEHDLSLPHVVAGMNLAIWPVSILLRGAGGFFVKRSFSGDRVFPAVFSRYLRELVRHGYPIEFFIEGGRTRSGKMLLPKIGVLGMVMEAAELRDHGREVTLLPVSLAYEQVAEEGSYAAELGGQPKRRESFRELLRARSILRRRYGRVYLRVGTPIPCSDIVDGSPTRPQWSGREREENREALQRIGERLLYRVGESTVVLSANLVAAALLAHHRRGIRAPELDARIARFRSFVRRYGLEESAALRHFDQSIAQALDRFARSRRIEASEANGQRVWSIVPEERITLDFYKNQILHVFAPAALAAAAIRPLDDASGFELGEIRDRFLAVAWLIRREFVFDPDRSLGSLLESGVDALVAHGAVAIEGGRHRVVDGERMGEIHGLIRPLLESYLLLARADGVLARGAIGARELPAALQAEGEGLLSTGAITRPEALSLVNLQNGIASLVEDRVLEARGDALAIAPAARDATVAWLRPMVE